MKKCLDIQNIGDSEEPGWMYKAIFNNSLDAIFLTSPDGSILTANPAACRMFGRTEVEIIKYGRNLIIDSSDPRLKKALKERIRHGFFYGELTGLRKDGTRFPIEVSSTIFTDDEGKKRTSIIIRDITRRKNAELALTESEKKYRSLFEMSVVPIWELDLSGVKKVFSTLRKRE